MNDLFFNALKTILEQQNYELKRTTHLNKFYPVDFQIFKNDELIHNIDFKIVDNLNNLHVGIRKIQTFDYYFTNTLMLWYCNSSNTFCMTSYSEELLNLPTQYVGVCAVKTIPRCRCDFGYLDFVLNKIIGVLQSHNEFHELSLMLPVL